MAAAGQGIVIAILMALGFLTPQTMVSSDPGTATGNGQFAAPDMAVYLPADADGFIMLNTSSRTLETCRELWVRKLLQIDEINRAITDQAAGTDRKNREFAAVLKVARQVMVLHPSQVAAGIYVDGPNQAIHVLAALQCERMENLVFFLTTMGIFIEGDGKAVVETGGEWTRIRPTRPVDRNVEISLAVSGKAVLFEIAFGGPPALIERVVGGTFIPATAQGTFMRQCVTTRGDGHDLLFAAVSLRRLCTGLAQAPAPVFGQAISLFDLAEAGDIVYAVRAEGRAFKEHFAVLNASGKGLFTGLVNRSQPLKRSVFQAVPADAVMVTAGAFNIDQAISTLTTGLRRDPRNAMIADNIDGFFQGLTDAGVDVRSKFIMPLDGTICGCTVLPAGPLPVPGIGLLMQSTAPAGAFELLELLQNNDLPMTRREIAGQSVYAMQLPRLPFVLTAGTLTMGSERFILLTSSPELFARMAETARQPGLFKFAPAGLELPADTLFMQFVNTRQLGTYTYSLLQANLPLISMKAKPLARLNPAALPDAAALFGDAPDYFCVTTRARGTEIVSPLPLARVGTALPALLPIAGHGLMRMINAPAEKFLEGERELEQLREDMKKNDVDIF